MQHWMDGRMIGWTDRWMGKERIRLKNRRKSVGKGQEGQGAEEKEIAGL